jgi:calpain-15
MTKQRNVYGRYSFRIFDALKGDWEHVHVDTLVPIENGKVRHCHPNGNEMWCCLLEKAFAKFCGSYANLSGGSTGWALTALTGYPTFILNRSTTDRNLFKRWDIQWIGGENRRKIQLVQDPSNRTELSGEAYFNVLAAYDRRKAIMACSIKTGRSDAEKTSEGLVLRHAYTLLAVRKVGELRMMQVRNPWGSGEWTGPWCDRDARWAQDEFKDLKKKLKFVDANDGSFWMEFSDFTRNFDEVAICARTTGFEDLALEIPEELGCCGLCCGCVGGCICFWCGCKGCAALCCGEEASMETLKGDEKDGCCA